MKPGMKAPQVTATLVHNPDRHPVSTERCQPHLFLPLAHSEYLHDRYQAPLYYVRAALHARRRPDRAVALAFFLWVFHSRFTN